MVLEAIKVQGIAKNQSSEISKFINSLQKYLLVKIADKRDQLKNSNDTCIGNIFFSDLFNSYIAKEDKLRQFIVSNIKNYWTQSLEENFAILQEVKSVI